MFSLSSFHHYQLIFYAIALVAMDILILTVVIPWRKQIVEDRVKYIAFLMLVPIFLMGLTIFVSTKYNGDGCLKWFVLFLIILIILKYLCIIFSGNQICLSNGQTCVQCNTGYYLSYKDLANGIVNCLQVPLDPNRTEPDSCLRKIHF